ncbi:MAG: spermine synthase [Candidatus Omnitrophica bacterium]|nr:spermine synthase [Candidatus Omnitrophota bacterium]
MKKRLIFTILVTGLSGLVAQIILLREFLIVFLGNELSIGIILSNWLILEAAGSYSCGKLIERTKRKTEIFVLFLLVFSLTFPVSLYSARILKGLLGLASAEALGLNAMFYSSFLLLLGVSFSHGGLFAMSCKIYSEISSSNAKAASIGKVYVLEMLGMIFGGVVLTYLLIPHFDSFKICFAIGIVNFFAAFLLSAYLGKTLVHKIFGIISLLLIGLFIFVFLNLSDSIHARSIEYQWPGQEILYYKNSIYGNVAVTKKEEQLTFFSNGVSMFSAPYPDIAWVEDFAHFALLSHPNPENILILSGGIAGLIEEVAKYPSIKRIDYAELDPLLLKAVKLFPTRFTESQLRYANLFTSLSDGRFFLKNTPFKYDVIFVGLDMPLDLQTNRFFTEEFFSQVKARLNPEGILVLSLPGSLTYLNRELRSLNLCIINTLKEAYTCLKVIPGDSRNIFLASKSSDILETTPELLYQRLQSRQIKSHLLTPRYFEYRLALDRQQWFESSFKGLKAGVNQDFKPLGLFYSLLYFSAKFSPGFLDLFWRLKDLSLKLILVFACVFTFLFLSLTYRLRGFFKSAVGLSVATSGFCGMVFDLAIIFAFQVIYGYVFYWIAILVSAFMLGSVLGGLVSTLGLKKAKDQLFTFFGLESAIVIFSLCLPFVFLILHPFLEMKGAYLLTKLIFLSLCLIAGFLIGGEFPLANKIYSGPKSDSSGATAGFLYSADLLGGFTGGILGAIVFLPILGFKNTFLILVIIKLSSLAILLISKNTYASRLTSDRRI